MIMSRSFYVNPVQRYVNANRVTTNDISIIMGQYNSLGTRLSLNLTTWNWTLEVTRREFRAITKIAPYNTK